MAVQTYNILCYQGASLNLQFQALDVNNSPINLQFPGSKIKNSLLIGKHSDSLKSLVFQNNKIITSNQRNKEVIVIEKTKPVSKARNKGTEKAKGDIRYRRAACPYCEATYTYKKKHIQENGMVVCQNCGESFVLQIDDWTRYSYDWYQEEENQ